jgi:hypothetical protein
MLYFLKNYIYIYIYTAFSSTFPFFEGLFRIVSISETLYRFPVSCNLAFNIANNPFYHPMFEAAAIVGGPGYRGPSY